MLPPFSPIASAPGKPIPHELTPAGGCALEAGRLRADRDWLLRGIEAVQQGLDDQTAPEAWRNLLAVARWMRSMDQKREGTS